MTSSAKRARSKGRKSPSTRNMAQELHHQMTLVGLNPTPEYRFSPHRRWRADFAFPEQKVLVEFEGATWIQGRHTRGKGFEDDCQKYAIAALLGYQVYRFTAAHVKNGWAIRVIELAIEQGRQVKRLAKSAYDDELELLSLKQ
jgi:very-short-patch-repair endonuclease